MSFLIAIGLILLWISCGFVAFIWYVKLAKIYEFNSSVKWDLAAMCFLGLLALVIIAVERLMYKFNNLMINLLKKNRSK